MAEIAFLAAAQSYLQGALLNPAPAQIGVAEPDSIANLPAIVLSLESSKRAGNGLGERSALITAGALKWTATIDLAKPVLPEDASLRLLDDTRTNLTLPHGGLVRSDGSNGALRAGDLTVSVAGANVEVVSGAPGAGQLRVDPAVGKLTFGAPLPATGLVEATYFLGQWEQRVVRIQGVLRADICADAAATVATLSDALVAAMTSPAVGDSIKRLRRIEATGISSIGPTEQAVALRRRTARFSFDFENEDNNPDSSGGVIVRIPITTKLNVGSADPNTGAVIVT